MHRKINDNNNELITMNIETLRKIYRPIRVFTCMYSTRLMTR